MRAQCGGDLTSRIELLRGQGIHEQLANGVQMGGGSAPERIGSLGGEHHLGAAAVGNALLAPDQTASLHAPQMVGKAAAFPADSRGELGRSHSLALSLAECEEDSVVAGRE